MKPVILVVMDGWGYSRQKLGNAILNAATPNIDLIEKYYPSILLQASGRAVGMNWGETGNSEVGHLSIGAGRIIFQYLSRIDKSILEKTFFINPAFTKAMNQVKEHGSALHIAGLLTSGSVHAYMPHLFAILDMAKESGVSEIYIHAFMDGRDSGLKEGVSLIKKVQDKLNLLGAGKIATVIGRDFAMERDKNWAYTETAHNLIAHAIGDKAEDPITRLEECYKNAIYDPKIPPTIFLEKPLAPNDALIFFNFREDSMRQLTASFVEKQFEIFPVQLPENLYVASMTQYLENENLHPAFSIPDIPNGLAEVISKTGLKQFHIAETEKYAHATYFFNCLKNQPFDGETDIFIDSVHSALEQPEMRAPDIADRVLGELERDYYDFFIINFANADILAHTGNLEAAVKGVEAVDKAVGRLREAIIQKGGAMLITADHGNAESIVYKQTGDKSTRHDDNPVPCYLVAEKFQRKKTEEELHSSMSEASGILADVAPTVLELLEIPKPPEMTGDSLLEILK